MSAALFERAAEGRHAASSAGTTPAERVHPEVIEVMRELGVDLPDPKGRPLDEVRATRDLIATKVGGLLEELESL